MKPMKQIHSRMTVKCSWCSLILQEGRGPEKEIISHGCCCHCKATHFPTLDSPSECNFELLHQEHEDDGGEPVSMNYSNDTIVFGNNHVTHLNTVRCSYCHKEEDQTEDCECEPEEQEYERED